MSVEEKIIELSDETEQPIVEHYETFTNIHLTGDISNETINPVVYEILSSNMDPNKIDGINLFIDSGGGDLYSALKLIDVMNMSRITVRTIGWGSVASAALMILMHGHVRMVTPNCSLMSHHASYELSNVKMLTTDSSVFSDMKQIAERVMNLYVNATGQNKAYIRKHLLRDSDVHFMADDAVKYGVVDLITPHNLDWVSDFRL